MNNQPNTNYYTARNKKSKKWEAQTDKSENRTKLRTSNALTFNCLEEKNIPEEWNGTISDLDNNQPISELK